MKPKAVIKLAVDVFMTLALLFNGLSVLGRSAP